MAPVTKLPPILEFHTFPDLDQTDVLDALFEPSPAIHAKLIPVVRTAEYSTWPELIDACHIRLLALATSTSTSSPDPTLLSILGSHPRLGEKKIESAHSAAEQANIQRDTNEAQAEELARLNRLYEETFPGLRYVVFVNGRGRPEIMEDMKTRIARADYTKEVDAALQVRTLGSPPCGFFGLMRVNDVDKFWNRPCAISQRTERPSLSDRLLFEVLYGRRCLRL